MNMKLHGNPLQRPRDAATGISESFRTGLDRRGISLVRARTRTLQINTGLICGLECRHCHLDAGPQRREVMTLNTMQDVIAYASRVSLETIDVTGGSPELVPHIEYLLGALARRAKKLLVRTNLVALGDGAPSGIMRFYRDHGISLVASFPSLDPYSTDAVRGKGVWGRSVEILRELNRWGYGRTGSGLELNLAVNPTEALLPEDQSCLEKDFRRHLEVSGIAFNSLYSLANVPLGRFRRWLERSGSYGGYMQTLVERFNPAALDGLMCRSLISVSWDGYLYDCDFNLSAGLHHGPSKLHVSSLRGLPREGIPIPNGDHCYACAAGSGFT